MAMKACKECNKEISTKAEKCPNCGAPQPKKTSTFTWIVGGVFALFVVSLVNLGTGKSTTPTPEVIDPAKKLAEERLAKTVVVVGTVKKALRDPDSVVWEDILANDDASVVCIQYRAKNGFGGFTRGQVAYAADQLSQKAAQWNKFCAGKKLNDMSHAAQIL